MAACHDVRKILQDNQAVDIVYNVTDKEISQSDAYNIDDAECAALVIDSKGRRLKAVSPLWWLTVSLVIKSSCLHSND
jgi:hypothetical protein